MVNPYARRGFGQMATCTAQLLSSVINSNQVEAASRHHLPRIRDVGSSKRIVPRFDTDPPLPGLEDEVRHAAHHMICLLYTSDAADDLLCVHLGGRRIIKKTK